MTVRAKQSIWGTLLVVAVALGGYYAGEQGHAQEAVASSLSPAVTQADLSAAASTNLGIMDSRIQGGTVTLSAAGTATWTYTTPYAVTPVLSYMAAGDGGTYPVQCNFTSKSATAASIKCYKGAPVVVSVLGATVNAFQGTVTGVQVDIHARPLN